MDLEALRQGGVLMLVGMAVVFLFLVVLIFVINFTTFIARKLKWGEVDCLEASLGSNNLENEGMERTVAAIAAAAHHKNLG